VNFANTPAPRRPYSLREKHYQNREWFLAFRCERRALRWASLLTGTIAKEVSHDRIFNGMSSETMAKMRWTIHVLPTSRSGLFFQAGTVRL
jgi:hypothetical protein